MRFINNILLFLIIAGAVSALPDFVSPRNFTFGNNASVGYGINNATFICLGSVPSYTCIDSWSDVNSSSSSSSFSVQSSDIYITVINGSLSNFSANLTAFDLRYALLSYAQGIQSNVSELQSTNTSIYAYLAALSTNDSLTSTTLSGLASDIADVNVRVDTVNSSLQSIGNWSGNQSNYYNSSDVDTLLAGYLTAAPNVNISITSANGTGENNITFTYTNGSVIVVSLRDVSGSGAFVYSENFNQNLNTTDSVLFAAVDSADWTNVTITESQITDFGSYWSTTYNFGSSNLTYQDIVNSIGNWSGNQSNYWGKDVSFNNGTGGDNLTQAQTDALYYPKQTNPSGFNNGSGGANFTTVLVENITNFVCVNGTGSTNCTLTKTNTSWSVTIPDTTGSGGNVTGNMTATFLQYAINSTEIKDSLLFQASSTRTAMQADNTVSNVTFSVRNIGTGTGSKSQIWLIAGESGDNPTVVLEAVKSAGSERNFTILSRNSTSGVPNEVLRYHTNGLTLANHVGINTYSQNYSLDILGDANANQLRINGTDITNVIANALGDWKSNQSNYALNGTLVTNFACVNGTASTNCTLTLRNGTTFVVTIPDTTGSGNGGGNATANGNSSAGYLAMFKNASQLNLSLFRDNQTSPFYGDYAILTNRTLYDIISTITATNTSGQVPGQTHAFTFTFGNRTLVTGINDFGGNLSSKSNATSSYIPRKINTSDVNDSRLWDNLAELRYYNDTGQLITVNNTGLYAEKRITANSGLNSTASSGCNYMGSSKMCWNTTTVEICPAGATGGLC